MVIEGDRVLAKLDSETHRPYARLEARRRLGQGFALINAVGTSTSNLPPHYHQLPDSRSIFPMPFSTPNCRLGYPTLLRLLHPAWSHPLSAPSSLEAVAMAVFMGWTLGSSGNWASLPVSALLVLVPYPHSASY